ncbi:hypothetical protein AHAS_Ahas13G0286800 [Arachis hypogaea]
MKVNGEKGLVSRVESYVEEGVHRHMLVVVDNQKGAHRSHYLGMPLGMALGNSMLGEVVAKRVDQILVAPPIFDCSILDACSHCNLLFLQHSCNQTHCQRGESS